MRILLLQTSFLGDVVLATALIGAIKKLEPTAELWMMVTPQAKPLLAADPRLAGLLEFDKRGADSGLGLWRVAQKLRNFKFDRVYALQRSLRTAVLLKLAGIPERIGYSSATGGFLYTKQIERPLHLHEVQRALAILGQEQSELLPEALQLFVKPEAESALVQQGLISSKALALLAPGSVWATKRWSAAGFNQIAQKLLERGFEVALIGAKNEFEIAESVKANLPLRNLAGKLSLDLTMALVKNAALLVCNDSMPLHLASAFKTPSVAIFCATSPSFGFAPWQNPAAVVVEQSGLSCKPCTRHGSKRCPTGTAACMQLSSEQVWSAIEGLLAKAV